MTETKIWKQQLIYEQLTTIFGEKAMNALTNVEHLIGAKDALNEVISWLLHYTVCDNVETLLYNHYRQESEVTELEIINLEDYPHTTSSHLLGERGFLFPQLPDILLRLGATTCFIEVGTGMFKHNTYGEKVAEWIGTWSTDTPCHVLATDYLGDNIVSPKFPLNAAEIEAALAELVQRHVAVQTIFTYRAPKREKVKEPDFEWSPVTEKPMKSLMKQFIPLLGSEDLTECLKELRGRMAEPFEAQPKLVGHYRIPKIIFDKPPDMEIEYEEDPSLEIKRPLLDIEDDYLVLQTKIPAAESTTEDGDEWGLSNKALVTHFFKTVMSTAGPRHSNQTFRECYHSIYCWLNGNSKWSMLSDNLQFNLGRGLKKRKETTTWLDPLHKPNEVSYSTNKDMYRIPARETKKRPIRVNPMDFEVRNRLATKYDTEDLTLKLCPEWKPETAIDWVNVVIAQELEDGLAGTGYARIIDKMQNFGMTILNQYSKVPESFYFVAPIASRTILKTDEEGDLTASRRVYGVVIVGERHGKESSDQIEMIQIELYSPRLNDLGVTTRKGPKIRAGGHTVVITTPSYTLGTLVRYSNALVCIIRPLSISERVNLKQCGGREFDLEKDFDMAIVQELAKAITTMTIRMLGQSYSCLISGGLQLEHLSNLLRHIQLWKLFCKSGMWGHRNGIQKEIDAISGFNPGMSPFLQELKACLNDLKLHYPA